MKKCIYTALSMFCLFFILTTQTPAKEAAVEGGNVATTEVAKPEVEKTEVAETKQDDEELTNTALSVVEAKICEGIIDQEPVAPGDIFSKDTPVLFCFSRIEASEATEVKHIWYFQNTEVAEVPLSIGVSSGWRTYSSKNISPMEQGNWKVEIVTASGEALKTIQFVVN